MSDPEQPDGFTGPVLRVKCVAAGPLILRVDQVNRRGAVFVRCWIDIDVPRERPVRADDAKAVEATQFSEKLQAKLMLDGKSVGLRAVDGYT